MIQKIRSAFTAYLNTITPIIATAKEGVTFSPVGGTPYQEIFILPALNDNYAISETSYLATGIFQINLYYPFGSGTKDIEERIALYMANFKVNQILTKDTLNIYLTSAPQYRNLGKQDDRQVYTFYVNYRCWVKD